MKLLEVLVASVQSMHALRSLWVTTTLYLHQETDCIVKLLEVLVASVHNPLVLPVGHHYLVPAPKDRLHREAA